MMVDACMSVASRTARPWSRLGAAGRDRRSDQPEGRRTSPIDGCHADREGAAMRIDGWGGTARGVTHVDPAGFLKVPAFGIDEQRVRVRICDSGVRDARVREVRSRTVPGRATPRPRARLYGP